MSRLLAALVISLLGLCMSSPASAWGDTGHRTVCEIALRNLTPTATAEVSRLLQVHPAIKSNPLRTEFGWACTYPDHPAAIGPGRRSPEHFVNYPRTLFGITESTGCVGLANCVLTAIPADDAILRSATATDLERAAALVYFGHWFGDIHQPLHSSFADDRGGNEVNVSGLCTSNLHSAWDTCILQSRSQLGSGPSVDAVRALAAAWSAQVTDIDRALWLSSVPWQWSAESYEVSLQAEFGYCVIVQQACGYSLAQPSFADGQPKRTVLVDAAYMDRAFPIIQRRIMQAGIRLAHRLNLALDPTYRG
jgi:hypothetical protein